MIYKVDKDKFVRDVHDNEGNHLGYADIVTYEIYEGNTDNLVEAEFAEVFKVLYDDQWLGTMDLEKVTLAIIQEASEAMNELDWKYWKTIEPNLEAFKEELADIFIFTMMAAKIVGMSASDFIELTLKKHTYNKHRPDHDRNKGD